MQRHNIKKILKWISIGVLFVITMFASYVHGYIDSIEDNYQNIFDSGIIRTYSYRYIWCDTVLTDTGYTQVVHSPNENVYKIEDPQIVDEVIKYNKAHKKPRRCVVWEILTGDL